VHRNEKLVRDLHDARGRGDRDAIRAILSPDIVWHDPYPAPHGGDFHGIDDWFKNFYDANDPRSEGTDVRLHDVLANDQHVVTLVEWSSTLRGKGSIEGREVGIYHVQDGRVAQVWFFLEEPSRYAEFFS
jgi:ketosteroid isomerase-like protein